MKYCENYAALLDPFVDGELPPEDMARVQAHLETCPGCRAYVDDALAIRAAFPDAEETLVPEGFAEGVMERIRAGSRKSGKVVELRSLRRWTGTLAALAACCALVIVLRYGSGGPGADGMSFSSSSAPADCAADEETVLTEGAAASEDLGEPAAAVEGAETYASDTAGVKEDRKKRADEAREGANLAMSPMAPAEDKAESGGLANEESVLYLSAGEAGDLLEDFDPAWEEAGERGYELNAGEYAALLAALGRQGDAIEGTVYLVVVTGAPE